jgi:hypothetical protein
MQPAHELIIHNLGRPWPTPAILLRSLSACFIIAESLYCFKARLSTGDDLVQGAYICLT